MQKKKYNTLGQCIQITDIDWLRTPEGPKKQSAIHDYEYNDWGQVCKGTDSNGIITLAVTDPIAQTYTEGIKGPDSWSPFTSGEIKSYSYCCGDPINRIDPSGHFSVFGIQISWRDFAQAIVGFAFSVLAGILSDGASVAIEVGVDLTEEVTVAVASEVGTGASYDVAAGKTPNLQSVGSDIIFGGVGNMVGRNLSTGAKKVFKSVSETLEQLLIGAEKLRVAGGKPVIPYEMGTVRSFKRHKLQAEVYRLS